jgi:biotin synthase
MERILQKIEAQVLPDPHEFTLLFKEAGPAERKRLAQKARQTCEAHYGDAVYTRGLIELSNHCRNDCYYCGIRNSNRRVHRYRLTPDTVLECCRQGYALGFRTFVLQGGEDPWFTDARVENLVARIHEGFPDCAITLSIGERSREAYQRFFDAGANRYLLRHETADPGHYRRLHPKALSLENRMDCLWDLKAIGYQVGTGFMVGSPGQTPETLAEDFNFIAKLSPHMIGIGPFIPQKDTPFGSKAAGTLELTLLCLSILRLLNPKALIPATTALGTIHPKGRELGILAGANVVMPNLSPTAVRKDYALYDNKICTGDEAAECRQCLSRRMESIGRRLVTARGDSLV